MLRTLLATVFAAVLAFGCGTSDPAATGGGGGDAGGGGAAGGTPGPQDMVPELLMAHRLNDVWVAPTGERFVVGERGMVAHFDGSRWIPAELPAEVRELDYRGVYGFAADNAYAVGEDFVILRFDGNGWTVDETFDFDLGPLPPQEAGFFGVWGSGPDNVYAAGDSSVVRFDGDAWNSATIAFDDGVRWRAVNGSSADGVFLAGHTLSFEAHAAYFNGSVWQSITVPAVMGTSSYTAVAVASPVAAFFAGSDGRISFWDGVTLVDRTSLTTDDFAGIWMQGANDALAMTTSGDLRRFNLGWVSISNLPLLSSGARIDSLFVESADEIYAAGTGVHRYDGAEWTTVLTGDGDAPQALWASGSDNALMLGERTYRYDGTRVTLEDFTGQTVGTLTAAWGPADNIVAVNADGSSFLFDGVNWGERNTNNTERLNAVWGSAIDDVFAVGANGTILHFDGAFWEPMTSGTTASLIDIDGSGPNDVYAVGSFGTIIHYDGNDWLPMNSGTDQFLRAVSLLDPSTIYALSDDVGPFLGNGATWMEQPIEIMGDAQDVGAIDGLAPDDFFLASFTSMTLDRTINHINYFDGTTFTQLPASRTTRSMLAVGPLEVLASFGTTAELYVIRWYVP